MPQVEMVMLFLMVTFFKENTTPIGSRAKQENKDLIERGVFLKKDRPEYCSEYEKIIQTAMTSQG